MLRTDFVYTAYSMHKKASLSSSENFDVKSTHTDSLSRRNRARTVVGSKRREEPKQEIYPEATMIVKVDGRIVGIIPTNTVVGVRLWVEY